MNYRQKQTAGYYHIIKDIKDIFFYHEQMITTTVVQLVKIL